MFNIIKKILEDIDWTYPIFDWVTPSSQISVLVIVCILGELLVFILALRSPRQKAVGKK